MYNSEHYVSSPHIKLMITTHIVLELIHSLESILLFCVFNVTINAAMFAKRQLIVISSNTISTALWG